MEPLIFIQKLFIRVLFTFLNMITLSFLTKNKIKKSFISSHSAVIGIDCAHLKPYGNLHRESQQPALRTWVCSLVMLLFLIVMLWAPCWSPAPPTARRQAPAPQLCKGFISVNNDFSFGQLKKWKFKERRRRRKVTQMHLKHEKNYLYDKNIFRFSKHKTE